MRPGRVTITLLRRASSGMDDYGNDTSSVIEVPLTGCYVYPRASAEGSVDAANQVITGRWLMAPATELIRPGDGVRLDDGDYEVDGEPGVWRNVSGRIAYQQVALRRVTG